MFKYAIVYEEKDLLNKIYKLVNPYLVQQTTPDKIIKSFEILLYTELTQYLKAPPTKAKQITLECTYSLFNQTVDMDGVNKYVWLNSSLFLIPIFGSSRTPHLTEKQKDAITRRCKVQAKDYGFELEESFLEQSSTELFAKPQYQYLGKFPLEFMSFNPKYSYLHDDDLRLNFQL